MRKKIFFLFILNISQNLGFSQEIPPPPPPSSNSETAKQKEIEETYKIKTELKAGNLVHSNKYFSLVCNNLGNYNQPRQNRWFATNFKPFTEEEREVSIWSMNNESFLKIEDELKSLKYDDILKTWDIERIGQYLFNYSPYTRKPFTRNLKSSSVVSMKKILIDKTNFIVYEFSSGNYKEVNYLTKIDNLYFIFHIRELPKNSENVMKGFSSK